MKTSSARITSSAHEELGPLLSALLEGCDEAILAAPYATEDGLSALLDAVESASGHDAKITFLLGYLDYGTDPAVFQRLSGIAGVAVRVATSSRFHAKIYAFRMGAEFRAIVGSANITGKALGVPSGELCVDLGGLAACRAFDAAHVLLLDSAPSSKLNLEDYRIGWSTRPLPRKEAQVIKSDSPFISPRSDATTWKFDMGEAEKEDREAVEERRHTLRSEAPELPGPAGRQWIVFADRTTWNRIRVGDRVFQTYHPKELWIKYLGWSTVTNVEEIPCGVDKTVLVVYAKFTCGRNMKLNKKDSQRFEEALKRVGISKKKLCAHEQDPLTEKVAQSWDARLTALKEAYAAG